METDNKPLLPHYNVSADSKANGRTVRMYPESKEYIEKLQALHGYENFALALDYVISEFQNQNAEIQRLQGAITQLQNNVQPVKIQQHTEVTQPYTQELQTLLQDVSKLFEGASVTPAITEITIIQWMIAYCGWDTSKVLEKLVMHCADDTLLVADELPKWVTDEIQDIQFPPRHIVQNTFPELFNTTSNGQKQAEEKETKLAD